MIARISSVQAGDPASDNRVQDIYEAVLDVDYGPRGTHYSSVVVRATGYDNTISLAVAVRDSIKQLEKL